MILDSINLKYISLLFRFKTHWYTISITSYYYERTIIEIKCNFKNL